MKNATQKISAGVVEPHEVTESFANQLPDGDIEVKILSVEDENPELASKYSENYMIECQYPDGFKIHHQVAKEGGEDALLTQIRNKLRGRHGVPHGNEPVEGQHGLKHVAGDLVGELPELSDLAGTSIVFKKVG